MKNGWGMVAGLAAAGLLVAAPPAWAGNKDKSAESSTTKSHDSSTSADRTGTSGSATGSTGSSTGSSATGSMGSSSTTDTTQSQASASSTGSNEVTGKVAKFNRSSKELTLALKVSDSTQVTKDGQQASLSDIKEGDQVRASFSGSGDTLQVTQIEVMPKGSTGTSGSSKSSTSGGASGSSSTGSSAGGSSSGMGGSSSSDQSGSSSSNSTSGSSGSSTGSGKGY